MTPNAAIVGMMTEAEFQDAVLQAAHVLGWMTYHTHDSRRSTAGFPDLVMVHRRQGRLIVAELKREKERPRPEQEAWLAAFRSIETVETHLWRPSDWDAIERTLRGR